MSLRIFALIYAIIFLGLGIAGQAPVFISDNTLFGLFLTDNLHNIIYLILGALALLGMVKISVAKIYFQIVGVLLGIAAVIGFSFAGDLYMIQSTMADNVLYLICSIIALYLGYILYA